MKSQGLGVTSCFFATSARLGGGSTLTKFSELNFGRILMKRNLASTLDLGACARTFSRVRIFGGKWPKIGEGGSSGGGGKEGWVSSAQLSHEGGGSAMISFPPSSSKTTK